jgi:hypothetical protein
VKEKICKPLKKTIGLIFLLCANAYGQALSDFSVFSYGAVKDLSIRGCRENSDAWKLPAQHVGSMLKKAIDQNRPNSEERKREIAEVFRALDVEKNKIFQSLRDERARIGQLRGAGSNSLQVLYDQHYFQIRDSGAQIIADIIVKQLDQDTQTYERLIEAECINSARTLEERLASQYESEISSQGSLRNIGPLPSVSAPKAPARLIIVPSVNPNACIQDGGPIYCPNYRGRR